MTGGGFWMGKRVVEEAAAGLVALLGFFQVLLVVLLVEGPQRVLLGVEKLLFSPFVAMVDGKCFFGMSMGKGYEGWP